MSLLEQRNSDIGVIEGRFIKHQLKIYGEDVMSSSKKIRDNNSFSSPVWSRSNFSLGENSLDYRIPLVQRFVDMKTRTSKGYTRGNRKIPGGKKKKKNYPIHNKPTMVHKKYLVKMLSFGFTEEVKEQFRKLSDEEI